MNGGSDSEYAGGVAVASIDSALILHYFKLQTHWYS